MSFTTTTNYDLKKPDINTEIDAWGDDYNLNFDKISTQMKVNADAAAAALAAATVTMPANTIRGSVGGGAESNLTAAQVNTILGTSGGGGVTAGSTPGNPKTASYTLIASDAGKMVTFNSGSTCICTINSGVFAAGGRVEIIQLGAGAVTFAGSATRRARLGTTARIDGQYGQVTVWFVTASEYVVFGDMTAAP